MSEKDLPERFTATDANCENCKYQGTTFCETDNQKKYGFCGNWCRRRYAIPQKH